MLIVALPSESLTAILALGFTAISWAADELLKVTTGQRSNLVLLAAVVPVAVAFVPVRARALRVADRFIADRTVITLLFLDLVRSTERLAKPTPPTERDTREGRGNRRRKSA